MEPTIVVGLLSLAGTLVGSLAGVLASNKMAMYRIEQLEEKVDKHNKLVEWRYGAEIRLCALEKSARDE